MTDQTRLTGLYKNWRRLAARGRGRGVLITSRCGDGWFSFTHLYLSLTAKAALRNREHFPSSDLFLHQCLSSSSNEKESFSWMHGVSPHTSDSNPRQVCSSWGGATFCSGRHLCFPALSFPLTCHFVDIEVLGHSLCRQLGRGATRKRPFFRLVRIFVWIFFFFFTKFTKFSGDVNTLTFHCNCQTRENTQFQATSTRVISYWNSSSRLETWLPACN